MPRNIINSIEERNNGGNFWKLNTVFTHHPVFKKFWKDDRSVGKRDSSIKMWCVALYTDPDSPYWELPPSERDILVKEYSKHWDCEESKYLIDAYSELILTQAERSLANFNIKLYQRDEFLQNEPYSLENAAELDKMLANTAKLYDMYDKIKEKVAKEDKTTTEGGAEVSLSDKGEI